MTTAPQKIRLSSARDISFNKLVLSHPSIPSNSSAPSRKMRGKGHSEGEIAAAFFTSVSAVKQRLRLASDRRSVFVGLGAYEAARGRGPARRVPAPRRRMARGRGAAPNGVGVLAKLLERDGVERLVRRKVAS